MSDLSKKEAYLAMFAFLDAYNQLSPSDEIGGLLGSMSLLEDGVPADPAIYDDWIDAVEKVKNNQVNAALKFKS